MENEERYGEDDCILQRDKEDALLDYILRTQGADAVVKFKEARVARKNKQAEEFRKIIEEHYAVRKLG